MRQELTEFENIMNLLKQMNSIIKQQDSRSLSLISEVIKSEGEINSEIFGCESLSDICLADCQHDIEEFLRQFDNWIALLDKELQCRKQIHNKIDYDFHVLSVHINAMREEDLVKESVGYLRSLRQSNEQYYEAIRLSYNLYHYFWGKVDLDSNNFELIENRVHEIKTHWEDFCWLYDNLEDYRSKKVLYGILYHWLTFDFGVRNSVKETNYDDYYDYDILSCSEEEIFVDLGAWNGDSAFSFINNFGEYKRIYCYEMTSDSIEEAKQKLGEFDNIVFRQVAVGDTNGVMHMDSFDDSSSNVIVDEGKIEIPMVRLDDDIREPITFIKMDIEGSEIEAMRGAQNHICNEKPKLAVCTYHNNHHIYEVPRLMREYNPDYKLYMRYNGNLNSALVSEFVTFAI